MHRVWTTKKVAIKIVRNPTNRLEITERENKVCERLESDSPALGHSFFINEMDDPAIEVITAPQLVKIRRIGADEQLAAGVPVMF